MLFFGVSKGFLLAQNLSSLDALNWLEGTWKARVSDDAYVIEQWQKGEQYAYEGFAIFINRRDTVSAEQLFLFNLGNHIVYIPVVRGQKPVLFNITLYNEIHFQAENPEHEYPQVIHYSRKKDGSILARISGIEDHSGEVMETSQEFHFKRIK
jgi:hypothetical protein